MGRYACWHLLSFLLFGSMGWAQREEVVLVRCEQIRTLDRQEAQTGHAVLVRGVVTLLPESPAALAIDDGTGIWVNLGLEASAKRRPVDLEVGDLVEVQGRTHQGLFAPIIEASRITKVGRGAVPAAKPASSLRYSSGAYDCQRIRLEGVVQVATERVGSAGDKELRLTVAAADGRYTFVLLGGGGVAADLVDRPVTVSGVCQALFNYRRQFLGYRIASNRREDLIVHPGLKNEAFEVPLVELDEILAFSPDGSTAHRRRVRGVVTHSRAGEYFYIQARDSALRINTRLDAPLAVGDLVEASGFFMLNNNKAEMTAAVFRRLGKAELPEAIRVDVKELLKPRMRSIHDPGRDLDDHRIMIEGDLVGVGEGEQGLPTLVIDLEGELVSVFLMDRESLEAFADFRLFSRLRVTGICNLIYPSIEPADGGRPNGLRLLLSSIEDVTVVRMASWWTAQRLWTALGLALGTLMILAAWSIVLRRRVAIKGTQLAEEMRARRDAVVEYESTLRERNRLAADLHDTIEQSLTGLSFQLEASQGLLKVDEVRSVYHLRLAGQLLKRSREDLRRSIWNLRATQLEQSSFVEALQKIARDRSKGIKVRILVDIPQAQCPINEYEAGNLLLLTQEGITNALKHSEATEIVLRLRYATDVTELTVEDNGVGFDPAVVIGTAEGRFGLQGMRERMKRLGGTLEIRSTIGQGTKIIASVQRESAERPVAARL